jgi:predicted 3-demethylubiquinone-9 3-methyltransferase (glyoxalase superfamily)
MAISAGPQFRFSEAVSFSVYCKTQDEIDAYWAKLSAVPEASQCGWRKDKHGLSWQIVPARMHELLRSGTQKQIARVTQAFLPMKKLDIAELERARAGR